MSQRPSRPPISKQQLAGLPADVRELVRTVIDYYETRIQDLELRLGRNPQNSSLPPSSEHPHAKPPRPKRKPSGRKRGGQKGHAKQERTLVPPEQVTETITLKPPSCRRCGETLEGRDPEPLRHQVFELPEIEPIITEYQRHRLTCRCCGVSTTAPLPEGVPEGQSGPRLIAFTALLMAYFRQSKRRTALFLEALCHIPCSTGLTVKHQNMAGTTGSAASNSAGRTCCATFKVSSTLAEKRKPSAGDCKTAHSNCFITGTATATVRSRGRR